MAFPGDGFVGKKLVFVCRDEETAQKGGLIMAWVAFAWGLIKKGVAFLISRTYP
ncbi:hypothetical protein FOMPIDRAFT_92755 [Fomitopsis schrenkii]|uniref:Uncharacterized protein n=1 Tax=Fomitopsis schrenkii TaxID=2126942 RepID=S8DU29_FOMSC|nr:hypothetical protein FOMPIDRAFT_92755 [Fomitopsis schrenkii]